jgi:hypothetical protein
MPSIAGWTPTRANLDAATARTAAVMASDAGPVARQSAAELEEAMTIAYLPVPGLTRNFRPRPSLRRAPDDGHSEPVPEVVRIRD